MIILSKPKFDYNVKWNEILKSCSFFSFYFSNYLILLLLLEKKENTHEDKEISENELCSVMQNYY